MMNFRHVLVTWLAFGLGLGVLGSLQIFLASGEVLLSCLWGIGLGFAVGLIGGVLRYLYLKRTVAISTRLR